VIVRDAEGLVLAAMSTTVPFITDPSIAEVVAAWKAVGFCQNLGL
jgi:hypothetical protein